MRRRSTEAVHNYCSFFFFAASHWQWYWCGKMKKMQFFVFFFSQLVGCDFQVEHREKPRLKNECFIYKENVSLLLNVLTVTTSSVVRQGRWMGRRRGVDSLVAAANRAWWFESLVSGSGGDLYVQVINGLVNHGHHARVSRIVSISGRYWLACISIVQR